MCQMLHLELSPLKLRCQPKFPVTLNVRVCVCGGGGGWNADVHSEQKHSKVLKQDSDFVVLLAEFEQVSFFPAVVALERLKVIRSGVHNL